MYIVGSVIHRVASVLPIAKISHGEQISEHLARQARHDQQKTSRILKMTQLSFNTNLLKMPCILVARAVFWAQGRREDFSPPSTDKYSYSFETPGPHVLSKKSPLVDIVYKAQA